MADPITLTIDGRRITARPGQTVIQAAMDAGIYIPYLCYMPSMKPYGACRMCVVETEAGGRKMTQASCTTPVMNDMVVETATPEIKELRQSIMDLLMTEHPHGCLTCHRIELCGPQDICLRHVRVTDRCTVCPKNERCELKDTVRSTDLEMTTPLQYHRRGLPIHTDDPFYDRDYNLCIVCARCVRVCEEVRFDTALSLVSRSGVALVGTSHGASLLESGCEFCGACIDVCPTGALVEREYKWEKAAKRVTTICPNCPVGCQMVADVNHRNKVIRMKGDLAGEANNGQACFKGKFAYDFPNHRRRLKHPMVRVDGELRRATWEEALGLIAQRMAEFALSERAVIASPRGTNEDNYVAQKLARVALGTNNVVSALDVVPDLTRGMLGSLRHAAASHPIRELEKARCVLVLAGNPTEEQNVLAAPVKKAARDGAKIVVIDSRETELTRYAAHWLRPRAGSEVTLLGGMLRVIVDEALEDKEFVATRCDGLREIKNELWDFDLVRVSGATGISEESIRQAARAYGANSPAAILYGADGIAPSQCTDYVRAIVNLALLTGNIAVSGGGIFPLFAGANTQGSNDMGCAPDLLPGLRDIGSTEARAEIGNLWGVDVPNAPGAGAAEIFERMRSGTIRAAILMADGLGPATFGLGDIPGALAKLDFLVVSDAFLSEMTHNADVVLPAATYAEVAGTYTNLERRVQLLRPGMALRHEERAGWEALSAIARALGASGFDYASSAEVFDEIRRAVPAYAGLSHERLADGGVQWPCPSPDHPGTPLLYADPDPDARPCFTSMKWREPLMETRSDYPFVLAHGRVLHQPDRELQIVSVDRMNYIRRDEFVELHPADAAELGIREGDLVDVRTDPSAGQPVETITGAAKLTSPHRGLVSVTTLFGEVASAMQDSDDPDPAPRVRGLPLRRATVVRSRVMETAEAIAN